VIGGRLAGIEGGTPLRERITMATSVYAFPVGEHLPVVNYADE